MLEKIEGKRMGWQRMRWMDGINQYSGHEPEQTPGDSEGRESGMLQSMLLRQTRLSH